MPLQWSTLDLPWATGLDRRAHPYRAELPSVTALENLRTGATGALVSRDGADAIGGYPQEVEAAADWSGSLVVAGRDGVARRDDQDDAEWRIMATRGPRSVDVRRRGVVRSERGGRVAGSGVAGRYVLTAWSATLGVDPAPARWAPDGAVWVQIADIDTGAVVYGPRVVPSLTTQVDAVSVSSDVGRDGLQVVAHEGQYVTVFARESATSNLAASRTFRIVTIPGGGPILTEGATVVHAGVNVDSLIVTGDPAYSDVYGVADTRRLHRFVRSALTLTLESTCVIDDAGDMIGVWRSATHVTALGDDGATSELTYCALPAGVSLPASGTATLYHSYAGEPTGRPRLAVGAARPDGTGLLFYEGSYAPTPSLYRTQTAHIRWVTVSALGVPSTSAKHLLWHVSVYAWPWAEADGRILLPLVAPTAGTVPGSTGFADVGLIGGFSRSMTLTEWTGAEGDPVDTRRIAVGGIDTAHDQLGRRRPHTYAAGSDGPRAWSALTVVGPQTGRRGQTRGLEGAESRPLLSTVDTWLLGTRHVGSVVAQGSLVLGSGLLSIVDGVRHGESMQLDRPVVLAARNPQFGASGHVDWLSTDAPAEPTTVDNWTSGNPHPLVRTELRFVWQWRDASGAVHRSAPSAPIPFGSYFIAAGVAGNPQDRVYFSAGAVVRVAVPPFCEWRSRSDGASLPTGLSLECYISPTEPYADTGEPIVTDGVFGRQTIRWGGTLGAWANERVLAPLEEIVDTSAPAWTVPLTLPLAAGVRAIEGLPLYTNGGVLPNDPTPSPAHIATTRERVWLVDSDRRDTVWFSKRLTAATGLEWSGALTLSTPTEAGDVVALGTVDDRVCLLTERAVYALDTADAGPDATGEGGWPPLRRVTGDTGCVTPASVVETDAGLFFAGEGGIYRLDGGGALTWVGRPVGDALDVSQIVAATAVPGSQMVAWATSDRVVTYDWDHDAWSVSRYPEPTEFGGPLAAIVAHGAQRERRALHLVTEIGDALRESWDAGERVAHSVTTSWVKVSGLQGAQRIRRWGLLGRIRFVPGLPEPPHGPLDLGTLRATVAYDYDPDDVDVYEITLGDVARQLDPMRLRMRLRRQACQSIRWTIEYLPPPLQSQSGAPYVGRPEWAGLAVEAGAKRRLRAWAHGLGPAADADGDLDPLPPPFGGGGELPVEG